MSLKAKIEAVIYASEEPVTLAQLAGLLGLEAQAELDRLDSAQQRLALEESGAEPEAGDHDVLNGEVLSETLEVDAAGSVDAAGEGSGEDAGEGAEGAGGKASEGAEGAEGEAGRTVEFARHLHRAAEAEAAHLRAVREHEAADTAAMSSAEEDEAAEIPLEKMEEASAGAAGEHVAQGDGGGSAGAAGGEGAQGGDSGQVLGEAGAASGDGTQGGDPGPGQGEQPAGEAAGGRSGETAGEQSGEAAGEQSDEAAGELAQASNGASVDLSGGEAEDASRGERADGSGGEPVDEKALAREARERERRLREYFRSLLDELIREYARADRGLEIREVAGGYRLATKPEYHDAVRGFVKSLKPALKLSLQALETLAVVAYKQPVTAPEVSEIRGVDSGGVLGSLMTRKLVATAGRKQVIGRPILYKTTKEFLIRFGLKDLSELPSIEEFEKLAGELAEQEEIPMEHHAPESPRDVEQGRDKVEPQADGDTNDLNETVADEAIVDGRLSGLSPNYDADDYGEGEDSPARDAEVQSGEKSE